MRGTEPQYQSGAVVQVTLDEDGFWPLSFWYEGVEHVVLDRVDYEMYPEQRIDGVPVEQYIFETDLGVVCLRRAGLMFWLEWFDEV